MQDSSVLNVGFMKNCNIRLKFSIYGKFKVVNIYGDCRTSPILMLGSSKMFEGFYE